MSVLKTIPLVSCAGAGASSRKEEPGGSNRGSGCAVLLFLRIFGIRGFCSQPSWKSAIACVASHVGSRILGQEVGTKVLFKFLGGVVAVYAFLAPKLFERGDSE